MAPLGVQPILLKPILAGAFLDTWLSWPSRWLLLSSIYQYNYINWPLSLLTFYYFPLPFTTFHHICNLSLHKFVVSVIFRHIFVVKFQFNNLIMSTFKVKFFYPLT